MKTIMPRIVPSPHRSVAFDHKMRGACSITVLVAIVGAGALVMGALNNDRGALWIGAIAVCLFLVTGTGILPHALATRLQRPFPVKQPDQSSLRSSVCIIMLVEGSVSHPNAAERSPSWISGSRVVMAAALHRAARSAGATCRIVIAGERTRSDLNSDASYRRALRNLGVGDSEIIEEDQGLNTYQHARNISEIVKAHPAEAVCLVTSALHLKRALLYFGAFGLRPDPFPSDYIHVPRLLLPVGYNFAVADIALHQYIGILRFHVYEALGMNRRSGPK
jgi:uncharacterized SAM-binding protein YcdF (DUF218 family)